jgi:hypothetical protein
MSSVGDSQPDGADHEPLGSCAEILLATVPTARRDLRVPDTDN